MVGDVGSILNSVQLRQLTAMQTTARTIDVAQLRLASGRAVNSAIDNPGNFFAARALDYRAQDLQRLADGIDQSLEAIKVAQNGIEAINHILNTAESYLLQYEQDLRNGNVDLQEELDTSFFLDFSDPASFLNYAGGQDSGAPVTLIEDGFGVILDNNSWRRYQVNYTVTANTTLEFDFRSTNIPEIAGIGFDNDTDYANSNTQFFLYGQQTTGVNYSAPTPTYEYDGSGEWVHVSIPVGTHFTGNFSHLTFIDDDDGGGDDGDAQFRNVVIHEGNYVYGGTNLTVSDTYEEEYDAILDQIDLLVQDSVYRDSNLLGGIDLTTFFNEHRTSFLETESIIASSDGLGLERLDFTTEEAVERKLTQVREARELLRQYATTLTSDFAILKGRSTFTDSIINTLEEGRDKLTLDDQNRTGAEMLALQTRQSIQISVLANRGATIADFLT